MSHILVVEDAPGFRQWLVDQVQRAQSDAQVAGAGTRRAALAALSAGRPDLLLLDLAIPRDERDRRPRPATGLELLREVRQRWPETSVVVVSSHDDLEGECLAAGASQFVRKDGTELGAKVRQALHLYPSETL